MSDVIAEEAHVELQVGFFGGDRSLGEAPFERTDRGGRPVAGLDDPFAAYPLHDALVVGPRAEARVVAPPLRVSVGWQRPYPDWEPIPEAREPDGEGVPAISSVRALRTDEVVLGIGLEAPTGLLSPFVDVVGTVHVARVALEVDGVPATWGSESFSLGGRAGLRLQVGDHSYAEASGQYTPFGPSRWGAGLGLGVAFY